MALPLKYNTASQTIIIGPFLDDSDGKTAKTSLSISNTDIKLAKHNGTSFSNKNSGGATHIANGYYYCTLDATDTNTLGRLVITVNMSGALPVWHEFEVLSAQMFDALYGSGYAQVDLRQISGSNVSTSSAQLGVNVVQVGGTTQTARDLGANIDAAVSSRAAASTALSNVTWTDAKAAYLDAAISSRSTLTASDVWGHTTRTLTSFGTLVSDIWSHSTRTLSAFSTSLAVSVWDVLESAISTANSIGLKLKTNLDATVSSRAPSSTALSNAIWTDAKAAYLDATISSRSTVTTDGIADAVWDEALSGHLTSGSTGAALNAAGSAGDPWATSLPGAYGSGTAGYILGNRLDATVSSRASGSDYTSARAAKLDNLDTTVSSRADGSNYTSARAAKLDNLDAAISTRSTLTAADVWGYASGLGQTVLTLLNRAYRTLANKMTINETTGAVSLKDEAGTNEVATGSVTSASGVTTREKLTWL